VFVSAAHRFSTSPNSKREPKLLAVCVRVLACAPDQGRKAFVMAVTLVAD